MSLLTLWLLRPSSAASGVHWIICGNYWYKVCSVVFAFRKKTYLCPQSDWIWPVWAGRKGLGMRAQNSVLLHYILSQSPLYFSSVPPLLFSVPPLLFLRKAMCQTAPPHSPAWGINVALAVKPSLYNCYLERGLPVFSNPTAVVYTGWWSALQNLLSAHPAPSSTYPTHQTT